VSMPRLLREDTLVLATHNQGKVRELQAMLSGRPITLRTSAELGLPEPDETADTFIGNATIKALAGATRSGLPCLADDSGLCVSALGGQPGVVSALWSGPDKNWMRAMQRVHDEMGDADDRSARFVSVLVLAWPECGPATWDWQRSIHSCHRHSGARASAHETGIQMQTRNVPLDCGFTRFARAPE